MGRHSIFTYSRDFLAWLEQLDADLESLDARKAWPKGTLVYYARGRTPLEAARLIIEQRRMAEAAT